MPQRRRTRALRSAGAHRKRVAWLPAAAARRRPERIMRSASWPLWTRSKGLRYNPTELLLDPYARALSVEHCRCARASIDVRFRLGRDRPPAVPWRDTVIYELHVKGFTKLHPAVPRRARHISRACVAPVIGHLKSSASPRSSCCRCRRSCPSGSCSSTGWGTTGATVRSRGSRPRPIRDAPMPSSNSRTMVGALHAAGIEVILDVVFNHTVEGNEGPDARRCAASTMPRITTCSAERSAHYVNRTGTGNTIALRHPRGLHADHGCLRYWVEEMHVDGFRFDLAAVLGATTAISIGKRGILQGDRSRTRAALRETDRRTMGRRRRWLSARQFPTGWAEWNDLYRDAMRALLARRCAASSANSPNASRARAICFAATGEAHSPASTS